MGFKEENPAGTRQLIMEASCDDEYVDPQPSFVVFNVSPERARRLLGLMGKAREFKAQLNAEFGVDFDQFKLMFDGGEFVASDDSLDDAEGIRRGNVTLVTPGHEISNEQIEAINGEAELRMTCDRLHVKADEVYATAYTKHSNAYCMSQEIHEEWLKLIADGRGQELDEVFAGKKAA